LVKQWKSGELRRVQWLSRVLLILEDGSQVFGDPYPKRSPWEITLRGYPTVTLRG
jgi:hypothetical protein